jgi:hypothetical protein
MPIGPQGEKRPSNDVGAAIMFAKLATRELAETQIKKSGRVRSGRDEASARAKKLSVGERRRIAKKAASARWK